MAGIIAAQALANASITDFLIIESQDRIGGRARPSQFGKKADGSPWMVELGCNWVSGTQTDDGPINPIWELVR